MIALFKLLLFTLVLTWMSSAPVEASCLTSSLKQLFRSSNSVRLISDQDNQKFGALLIDDEFLESFGSITYSNPNSYKLKMSRFYGDQLLWRGYSYRSVEKSEAEILKMFYRFDNHMTSKVIIGKVKTNDSEKIRKQALAILKKHNQEIVSGKLAQMATDHQGFSPGYSYGYSTSKSKEFALRSALGVSDYRGVFGGKTNLIIGVRGSKKDLDLEKLSKIDPRYKYGFEHEQEVMGVAAADPESITIIQTIDKNGDVLLSYLRNPEDPAEIWIQNSKQELLRKVKLPSL